MVQRREPPLSSDIQIVFARLARKIGRGHDAIYHGTRHLPLVLRSGKLLPSLIGDTAVFFTRSPEVAAYWAGMNGRENDQFSGGILVLNRTSLIQNYRLEPSRYPEEWVDEREESIWDRPINIRRHLLGVVRQAEVDANLGLPIVQHRKKARTVSTTGTPQKKLAQYTAEEQISIKMRERLEGRKLTQQEINFSLDRLREARDLFKTLGVWKEMKAPARAERPRRRRPVRHARDGRT
jgi:hypothetical protein